VPITSRRYSLWTRLYKRMLLEPTAADNVTPRVSEVVVPVIQADAILQTPTAGGQVTKDLSGSSYVAYFTVPTGEEWLLSVVRRVATTAVSDVICEVTGIRQQLSSSETAGSVFYPVNVILRTGDTVGMSGTANGGDTARHLNIMYLMSDVAS